MDFCLFDSIYPVKSWSKSHWSYVGSGGTLGNGQRWMMGTGRKSSPWVVLMAWIYKDIIFIYIWAVIAVQCLWALQLSWTDSVMQSRGLAMFVGRSRTCPLLGVHEFSGILQNSCSRRVKWCKMCVKTEQRTFPESPRACRPQVPCAEKVFFPEVIFAKPSRMVYIQRCLFWSKQIGSSSTASLKKKIALEAHTKKKSHSLLEGSPQDCYNLYAFLFQCCHWGK